jgi:hypothetical protein
VLVALVSFSFINILETKMHKEEQVIEKLLGIISEADEEGYVSLADIARIGNDWRKLQGKSRLTLQDALGRKSTKELIDECYQYSLKPPVKTAIRSTGKHTVATQAIARYVASIYSVGFRASLLNSVQTLNELATIQCG